MTACILQHRFSPGSYSLASRVIKLHPLPMKGEGFWRLLYRITVPRIRLSYFPKIGFIAVVGAVIAGCYGILHDQWTFTLSSEYYTEVKFYQFYYLPQDVPDRIRVGMIGFLATAGMGGIFGWFLGRIAVPRHPWRHAVRLCLQSFALLFFMTLAAGIMGYGWGSIAVQDAAKWEQIGYLFGIKDLNPFVRVAIIHQAGYLGGFLGLIVCGVRLYRIPRTQPVPE